MPPPHVRHVFVCTNERSPSSPRPSCGARASGLVLAAFKKGIAELGLKGTVRACGSTCLDACEEGPAVVVYPEGVWYGRVAAQDADEVVRRHLRDGVPVERLRMR